MVFLLCLAALPAAAAGAGDAPKTTVALRNGVELPLVAAGVWQYTEEEAEASVRAAIEAGFVAVDTAYDYGNQKGVARALRGLDRSRYFLITKVPGCGVPFSHVSDSRCEEDTAARIEDDLAQLNTTVLDLLLIHFPPCAGRWPWDKAACFARKTGCTHPKACDAVRAQWRAMTAAYKAKKVRAIGVSNYCRACMECLADAEVKPMVNQVHYQIGMGPDPQGFKSYAASQGVVLQAYSALGDGGHSGIPGQSGKKDLVLHDPLTAAVGKKHNRTTAQIALKWIVSHGVAVVTKSSSETHLKEDCSLYDFELDAEDMQKLDGATFAAKDTPSFLCNDAEAANILV